jgi:hypothetical protein
MPDLDSRFDQFMATTLSFEDQYSTSPHSAFYLRALRQIRLGIKQGGFGLTSGLLTAPAASYVALREFRQWYIQYALLWGAKAIHRSPWLQDLTVGAPGAAMAFPHIVQAFEHAVDYLSTKWEVHGDVHDVFFLPPFFTFSPQSICHHFSLNEDGRIKENRLRKLHYRF